MRSTPNLARADTQAELQRFALLKLLLPGLNGNTYGMKTATIMTCIGKAIGGRAVAQAASYVANPVPPEASLLPDNTPLTPYADALHEQAGRHHRVPRSPLARAAAQP